MGFLNEIKSGSLILFLVSSLGLLSVDLSCLTSI